MGRAGEIIENPVTGERMVFHGVGAGTFTDDAFRADVFVRPYGLVAAAHVHVDQEERLSILAGRLTYRIGRDEQPLGARQTVSVPPGTPHLWWNDGDSEAHVLVELRPRGRAEQLFETLFALAREGKTDERGMPGLVQLAFLAQEHGYYPAGLPIVLERTILSAVAALARAVGYRATAASE